MTLRTLALALALSPLFATAADADITITIKDHKFTPAEVRVPAGKKIKLIIGPSLMVTSLDMHGFSASLLPLTRDYILEAEKRYLQLG